MSVVDRAQYSFEDKIMRWFILVFTIVLAGCSSTDEHRVLTGKERMVIEQLRYTHDL